MVTFKYSAETTIHRCSKEDNILKNFTQLKWICDGERSQRATSLGKSPLQAFSCEFNEIIQNSFW